MRREIGFVCISMFLSLVVQRFCLSDGSVRSQSASSHVYAISHTILKCYEDAM